jgi:hypothetical protein
MKTGIKMETIDQERRLAEGRTQKGTEEKEELWVDRNR